MYELDAKTLNKTGSIFERQIINNKGKFNISDINLRSQYALLEANGFYYNEVNGQKSNAPITLNALTDLSDRETVNINLLTHLEYERAKYLVSKGKTVAEAKKQAQSEIFNAFYITGDFSNSEDLNIFASGEGNAALLAMSVLMQANLSEASLLERLANFATDIQKDGKWDDDATAAKMAEWAESVNLAEIRTNIENWNLGSVPDFEKIVIRFWYKNYGLDECTNERSSEVLAVTNEHSEKYNTQIRYICKDNAWVVATDFEKDTYQWDKGEDAEIKLGDVTKSVKYVYDEVDAEWRYANNNDTTLQLNACTKKREADFSKNTGKYNNQWYVCKNREWKITEKKVPDTQSWSAGTDGELKRGDSTQTYYVYDGVDAEWQYATEVEIFFDGGCTEKREADFSKNTGKYNNQWYVCKNREWKTTEKKVPDTQSWSAGTDGELKRGDSTQTYYVYDGVDVEWRYATEVEISFDGGCTGKREADFSKNTGKYNNQWYVCKNREWKTTEKKVPDTQSWSAGTDGELKRGDSTQTYYVYDGVDVEWRYATEVEISFDGGCTEKREAETGFLQDYAYKCKERNWEKLGYWNLIKPKEEYLNSSIDYGIMTDDRDKQIYKTIAIGTQTWMAENLNYKTANSYCYYNDENLCKVAGRLYTWASAKEACPEGWHLPTMDDWGVLLETIAKKQELEYQDWDYNKIGKYLKSKEGWYNNRNGLDTYGFSALPAGYYNNSGFRDVGDGATFWSATEDDSGNACGVSMGFLLDGLHSYYFDYKYYAYSVRCLMEPN